MSSPSTSASATSATTTTACCATINTNNNNKLTSFTATFLSIYFCLFSIPLLFNANKLFGPTSKVSYFSVPIDNNLTDFFAKEFSFVLLCISFFKLVCRSNVDYLKLCLSVTAGFSVIQCYGAYGGVAEFNNKRNNTGSDTHKTWVVTFIVGLFVLALNLAVILINCDCDCCAGWCLGCGDKWKAMCSDKKSDDDKKSDEKKLKTPLLKKGDKITPTK